MRAQLRDYLGADLRAWLGIEVLGTPVRAIQDTEDRQRFNDRLREMSKPEFRWGLLPTAILTALIFWFGIQPNIVIVGGRTAAVDMIDPIRYISSTGLEVTE